MKPDQAHSNSESREELEKRVAAHPFLIGLSDHHVRLIVDCALPTRYERDQLIFRAGETANRFYLIETGRVMLESRIGDQPPFEIDVVEPGGLLGWSWLFPPYIWHFDARAVESTTAIFFYGTILREYCDKDPALGLELFKRMSEVMMRRLQQARVHLIEELQKARAKA